MPEKFYGNELCKGGELGGGIFLENLKSEELSNAVEFRKIRELYRSL